MRILSLAALAAFVAAPVLAADDKCDVPKENWRPVEELKADLTAKGWEISNIKTDKGCYEVYAKDKDGNKVEVYFNPETFEEAGRDD